MWIKICGNTNLNDALLAADAGADAVGFVFAASPRQVTAEQVRVITPHLPATLEKYGVFVEPDMYELIQTVEGCGLTGVQLHASNDPELPRKLRAHFGNQLGVLRVIHYKQDLATQLNAAQAEKDIDGILIDSRTATLIGGTGVRFDWQAAKESFAASSLRLIAAGGLNPENVAEAIATLHPWGVDVVSGVEAAPGRKDAKKVAAFVTNARMAATELEQSALSAAHTGN
jgi:phosphoribosylanthranilate isomerase